DPNPMRLRISLIICLFALMIQGYSQRSLDGEFKKEGIVLREYALYLPANYAPEKPISVVVAFHPLNRQKWSASAWRDTLTTFAMRNQVLLICPDAGKNGQADDPSDLKFAARLTRAILKKYQVNPTCLYTLGASWGSKAALKFAISERALVDGVILFANNLTGEEFTSSHATACQSLPIFLIHGKQDFLFQRVYSIQEGLRTLGACVKTKLIAGQGHQMEIQHHVGALCDAIQWLDNIRCDRQAVAHLRGVRISPQASDMSIQQKNREWIFAMPKWKDRLEHVRIYDQSGILQYVLYPPHLHQPLPLQEANTYRVVAKVGKHLVHKTVTVE
ncbi:MAG: hypothetical protein AAFR59_19075, partial [Bacteroidota bacterium]